MDSCYLTKCSHHSDLFKNLRDDSNPIGCVHTEWPISQLVYCSQSSPWLNSTHYDTLDYNGNMGWYLNHTSNEFQKWHCISIDCCICTQTYLWLSGRQSMRMYWCVCGFVCTDWDCCLVYRSVGLCVVVIWYVGRSVLYATFTQFGILVISYK